MRTIKFRAWNKEIKRMVNKLNLNFEQDDFHVLMQFTGLHDKNGKEIYEGDILNTWDEEDSDENEYKEIKFKDGQWWWGNDGGNSCPLYDIDTTRFEVIGNIYENPELIKN